MYANWIAHRGEEHLAVRKKQVEVTVAADVRGRREQLAMQFRQVFARLRKAADQFREQVAEGELAVGRADRGTAPTVAKVRHVVLPSHAA